MKRPWRPHLSRHRSTASNWKRRAAGVQGAEALRQAPLARRPRRGGLHALPRSQFLSLGGSSTSLRPCPLMPVGSGTRPRSPSHTVARCGSGGRRGVAEGLDVDTSIPPRRGVCTRPPRRWRSGRRRRDRRTLSAWEVTQPVGALVLAECQAVARQELDIPDHGERVAQLRQDCRVPNVNRGLDPVAAPISHAVCNGVMESIWNCRARRSIRSS